MSHSSDDAPRKPRRGWGWAALGDCDYIAEKKLSPHFSPPLPPRP